MSRLQLLNGLIIKSDISRQPTTLSTGDVTAQVAVIVAMNAQGYAILSLVKWQLKCYVHPYKTFFQYTVLRQFVSSTYSATRKQN